MLSTWTRTLPALALARSSAAPALARSLAALALAMVATTPNAPAISAPADVDQPQFELVMTIGREGVGPGEFSYVEDFGFSRDGHLIVTDAAHAFVQVFDKRTGAFITRFGGKGNGEENLERPEGIAVDADGTIFIGDYTTGLVKAYDPHHRWTKTFGGYGSALGQTMMSEFMDILDGRLYVPDIGNNRVNVFSTAGEPLFHFGGPGSAAGRFDTPESAKFNSRGQLFVADLNNDRIQVFDSEGMPLFAFGTPGDGLGALDAPAGIAFDRHDNVYVSEIANARVQVFDRLGNFIATWGQAGDGPGEFAAPHGVIVDPESGWIYVADTGNNRVQVFRALGTLLSDPS